MDNSGRGMALLLVFGCNNGAGEEPEKKNQSILSISNLRKGFLDIFTSFGDMISGVLGFSDKTKKSEVGSYFKKIKDTVQGTKDQLNTMVENMKREGNPNAASVLKGQ